MKKYKFVRYNKKYPYLFEKEKNKIRESLDKPIIEHVGSTSIPGLGGKGIIDIAIKTPKSKVKQFERKLKELGFMQTSGHPPNENSIFFEKIIKYGRKERRTYVHLVLNNHFWNTFIAVREYLKTHEKECKEYSRIKKEAVNLHLEGEKFRKYKNKFLENITKKALKEFK